MSEFKKVVRFGIRAGRSMSLALILSALLGAALAGAIPLDNRTANAEQVKAGFLFNFARFVEWPNPSGALVICVVGDDPFLRTLDQVLKDKTIEGRQVVARPVRDGDNPATCHVLFIPSSWRGRTTDVLQAARGPILTVGESVQFLREGGIIRFYVEDSRIKFQISRDNATTASLKISSHLLTLASR